MTRRKKAFLAVSAGILALGFILMACGFISSGFDTQVFTAQIDGINETVELGGVEVAEPRGLPLDIFSHEGVMVVLGGGA